LRRCLRVGLVLAASGWVAVGLAADEFVRQMNLGKAHLENRNSAGAQAAYELATKLEPDSAPARRNLARAYLLARQSPRALEQLAAARAAEAESAATAYLIGLVYLRESRFDTAVPFLEEAVRLDAFTVALRYQLAHAYQMTQQDAQAQVQLRETLRLDPLHVGVQFKLAAYAAQAGDAQEYDRRQQEFARLRKLFGEASRTPTALETCIYTRPESAPGPPPPPRAAPRVRFRDATGLSFREAPSRTATAAAVLEVDAHGRSILFATDDQGRLGLLALDPEGRWQRTAVEVQGWVAHPPFHQCVVGDFFNDVPPDQKYDPTRHARNDVLLVGRNGVALLQRTGPAAFTDVTRAAGLEARGAERAVWLDYDHDGDVDLALARSAGLELWQNRGDGTFALVTQQVGLEPNRAARDLVAIDLDANVAIDLIVASGDAPSQHYRNQRTGQFAAAPDPPGSLPPAQRVLAEDLDQDGYPELLLVNGREAQIRFGRSPRRHRFDLGALDQPVVALVDVDNDGRMDVWAAGAQPQAPARGAARLWQNLGPDSWRDLTESAGLTALELPALQDVVVGDVDGDGDSDLVLVTATGQLQDLRNEGGHAQGQLKVRLTGTKTNPLGLGTRLEVRAGAFVAVRHLQQLPFEVGLGGHTRLDSVQTIWSNGIVDNQIDLAAPPGLLTLEEKNVAAGSCPYLYAWDGQAHRFVTDLLGNAPLGLSLARGQVLPADPEELVWVGPATACPPRSEGIELVVTEELREVLFLDQVGLWAVDHPVEQEVHSTDKLGPPPFPPSELWALTSVRPPRWAGGDDGIDRTESLRAHDGRFAPPGPALPPPWRGLSQPLVLTLDFGPLEVERPWVLALTGWLQYGDASVNIAASQHPTLPLLAPRLEAETAPGVWQPIAETVGLPAGKTKTILCDLTQRLPAGTRRLRLVTSMEVRWDRIVLGERGASPAPRVTILSPTAATLAWRGFSTLHQRTPDAPQTPDYAQVRARPPWRTTPQGWCTRYGDVRELVTARDRRLLIMNGGDALTLRFAPHALPPLTQGWTRTLFFYSVGWDKDADHNVVAGDTVEPLPVRAEGDWEVEYNTRWVPADQVGGQDGARDGSAEDEPARATADSSSVSVTRE